MVAIHSQELHSAVAAVTFKKDAIFSQDIQLMCWELQFLSYQSEGKLISTVYFAAGGCINRMDLMMKKMAIKCCKHVDGGRAISKSKMLSRI
jgi:hypothetical protein